MKRYRMLRTHLAKHYVHGRGESNEHGLFGESLFASMGWDETFLPMETISPEALAAAKGNGPYDAAFFMPYTEPPTWLRSVVGPNCPIICWVADDCWRFDFTMELIAKQCADHYVTTDEASLAKYAAGGMGEHVTYSAFGTRPDWWPRLVTRLPEAKAQATFTGLLYGDRMARLTAVAMKADPETELVPIDVYDTQRDVMPLADYHQHMADSAFTLCLTSSSHGMPQMKARLFEPQIHGSVLVTEPLEGLERYWAPDAECLVFGTPGEAQDKMRALLADPAAYQQMSERAFHRAIREHSYQARFARIFDALGLPCEIPDFEAMLAPESTDV